MTSAVRLALCGTGFLILAIAVWSVGGDPPDAEANRHAISLKAEAERERLKRAHSEFRSLPPDRREAVRELHAGVESDPSLERSLFEYQAFLATLSAWEREEFRQESDPQKRIALIRKVIAERGRRRSPGRPHGTGRLVQGPVLPPDQLDAAMEVLSEALDLPDSVTRDLRETPDHVRHFRILVEAKKASEEGSGRGWDRDETVRKLLEIPEGDRFLKDLRASPSADDGQRRFRQAVVKGLLARSVLAEWHDAAFRLIPRDEFRRAFEELPEEQRNRLAAGPRGELVRAAIREVLSKRPGEIGSFADQFVEASELRVQLDPYFSRRHGPPFPFRGADDGREDRRGDRRWDDRNGDRSRDDGRFGDPRH